MLSEHDLIALKEDNLDERLKAGDMGTMISVHPLDRLYTVEFMTMEGDTITALTLAETQVRAVDLNEIAQSRPLLAGV